MDEAVPARMQEGVARTYRTDRIEVTWAPRRCTHAGECFRSAPEVFDPNARPWVKPETADPALQGEMTITISLADAEGGTEVVAVHDRLPPGLSPADNEAGWRSSLSKLAALVETRR